MPFRPGQIVRIRDQRWVVLRHLAYADGAILEVSGCDRNSRSSRGRFLLPAESVDVLPASRVPRVVRPGMWRHVARHALTQGLSARDLLRTIVSAGADVLPFQLEPALAVIGGLGSRVLIADEVGLGKTVQAGLIVAELLARAPDAHVLIVSPAGLREQWRDELELRFGIRATLIDSATLGRPAAGGTSESNPWRLHEVVVASIDYVKRPEVLRSLEATIWDALIFDEAHGLSGHSDRAAAAAALAARARVLVLLSATPHSGDDSAFAQLCTLGDLKGGFPLMVFRRTRPEVGMPSVRRAMWLRVRTTEQEVALHTALMSYARQVWHTPGAASSGARLAMTVLVRRACSSAASLTRSVERRLALLESTGGHNLPSQVQPLLPLGGWSKDDEEPAAVLMAPGFEDSEHEQRRLREILERARVAAHDESKFRALSRLLRRSREPVIVFTEYRDTLARLAASVRDLAVVTLHGGLTATERSECLAQFTRGHARVLIATDAASQGLNLQHRCRLVVNLELPWSPLRLEQRIGRVDRLGQRRTVHAVHFVARGTAEETTVARLLLRMDRIQSSTAALQRPVLDENDVAREVIGDRGSGIRDQEKKESTVVPTSSLIIPDLQSSARSEASRALTARRLGGGETRHGLFRPVASRISRRSEVPCCYWAFRLGYEDAGGIWQCDVVIGVTEPISRPATSTTASLREHVGQPTAEAVKAATREQWKTLAHIQERHRLSAELATRRELAILDAARQQHARVAARLLQPGLFDHRAERLAAAQSSLLDAVLADGTAHLRALERGASLRIGECELVFAVIIQ